MSLTCCIIRKPTSTSAGTAASDGITSTSGASRIVEQEQHAGDDRGQAGAGALADARGGLDVRGVGRDAAGATGGRGDRVDDQDPLGVRRDAVLVEQAGLGADGGHRAHRVEEVGQHQGEDRAAAPTTTPTWSKEPSSDELAERVEVGRVEHVVGPRRDVEAPALGSCRRPRPMSAIASTMIARTVVATIEIRIAPLTLRTHSAITSSQADGEDQRPASRRARRRRRAAPGTVVLAASGMRRHEAGVDEADERDEQADADRDRDLQLASARRGRPPSGSR